MNFLFSKWTGREAAAVSALAAVIMNNLNYAVSAADIEQLLSVVTNILMSLSALFAAWSKVRSSIKK